MKSSEREYLVLGFGQFVSGLTCFGSAIAFVFYSLPGLFVAMVGWGIESRAYANPFSYWLLVLVGTVFAFFYSWAMFIVFSRVSLLPPREGRVKRLPQDALGPDN